MSGLGLGLELGLGLGTLVFAKLSEYLGLVGYQVIKNQIIEEIEGICIVYTLMDVSFIH